MTNPFAASALRTIDLPGVGSVRTFSLEKAGLGRIARLPVVLRVILESLLRHCDGRRITEGQVRALAGWQPDAPRSEEIPFTVGRIALNCAAGIPLLGDLAAMRSTMHRLGLPVDRVVPAVPVDMALDHTLTVDFHGAPDALGRNMALEIERNRERFEFVKWAVQAYDGIRLLPPGAGILHQLNLEFLAPGILLKDGLCFPDTMVGTDSHTGMIAGLGVVGWGVGGIEAQGALLGQPVSFLTPDVVGVHVSGAMRAGVTATDLVLHVTEMLRKAKVVGKFVEFHGDGVRRLGLPDRATISNMAPEYGATIGYFPVDEQTCRYLRQTGRDEDRVRATEQYYRAQGIFGAPLAGEVDYSTILELDLSSVVPNVAGPKRPQDRVSLDALKANFRAAFGHDKDPPSHPRDGDVVIAAITSCTNTSNPSVMLAAGLLAKKAAALGLRAAPWVKTSLTPGSLVVSRYLEANGLQRALDTMGFAVAGYSCATCVGASGPLEEGLEDRIKADDVVACAVLSGNRNFEARIHPLVRASYLASPPLVVAFAIAGTVDIDLSAEPLGRGPGGEPVFLRDIWPTSQELDQALEAAGNPDLYRETYSGDLANLNPYWKDISSETGALFPWASGSTYIKEPPFLADPLRRSALADIPGARALAILGNSVTTDHISPIGSIGRDSPAGRYLQAGGVAPGDFNNYGARRMNHEVMIRGAFSNVRLKNLMVPGREGGVTRHHPSGEEMTIYDAAMRYQADRVPLIVIAGEEYGTGSARDWAAKGTRLLGVRAVVAVSFERIHRSNLVGMGVLPCQLQEGTTAETLGLDGSEVFDLLGLAGEARVGQPVTLRVTWRDGRTMAVPLRLRLDTQAELDYARAGGMMPYILDSLTRQAAYGGRS
ncbi:MAG: aconitate hydratase AcnA [Reyranellaceae bacterium]